MQLKRWESPRREGRNDKGKGGSARSRQLKKQQQMLRKKLKKGDSPDNNKNQRQGEENLIFPLFFYGTDIQRAHSLQYCSVKKIYLLGQAGGAGDAGDAGEEKKPNPTQYCHSLRYPTSQRSQVS